MIELKETYDPPYNLWYGVKHKNLLRFKITYGGSLPDASALPPKALMPGVMFHMENDGSNYMWNGVAWDKMDSNPFVGATSSKNGIQGLVPQPKKANREGFLYGGGGWKDLDASDVKTGVFNLARIPAAAMERLVPVDDEEERFALTTATVQNGDTVLQSDTKVMYRVVDQNELDNSSGYVEYQAARASIVPWSGITDTPETFTPSEHTHNTDDITSGVLPVSRGGTGYNDVLPFLTIGDFNTYITPGTYNVKVLAGTGNTVHSPSASTSNDHDGILFVFKISPSSGVSSSSRVLQILVMLNKGSAELQVYLRKGTLENPIYWYNWRQVTLTTLS